MLNKRRKGFTLIELLIVIVIIGILAAIAIPKFGKTREKAFFKAMQSDLRNLSSQQELYYSNPQSGYTYTTALTDMPEFNPSQNVTVGIAAANSGGWSATALHSALGSTQICAVFHGTATAVSPAATAGIVTCSEN